MRFDENATYGYDTRDEAMYSAFQMQREEDEEWAKIVANCNHI